MKTQKQIAIYVSNFSYYTEALYQSEAVHKLLNIHTKNYSIPSRNLAIWHLKVWYYFDLGQFEIFTK